MKSSPWLIALVGVVVAFLLSACSHGPSAASSTLDGPAADPAPTPTSNTARSGPGSLRSTLQGSCRLTALGAQIRVQYSATAFGSSLLARVRLFQDGAEVADSGPLERRMFSRVATFNVEPGEEHVFRVSAEATGAAAASAQSTVRCGMQATPIPGRRA